MRQGQGAKRSRGRNNGRRNAPARLQNYDSNGPSVRIRGNAYQVHEKYLQLARDASSAGDRIMAENYYQHAEHYLRIINADLAEAERNGQQVGSMPGQPQQNGQGQGGGQGPRGRGRRGNGGDHAGQPGEMHGGQGVEYGFDSDDDMDGDEDDGSDDRHLDPGDAEQPLIEPAAMAPATVSIRGTGTGG
ncbi:MAG: DUF4167 domain-containing protein [Alphaproteobacteria bacterium]